MPSLDTSVNPPADVGTRSAPGGRGIPNATGRGWWARLVDDRGPLGGVRRQWPWLVLVVFVLVGLALITAKQWRWGAGVIGAGMIMAGIFRASMRDPGILAIRGHRWIDLCFYYGLGVATIIFAIIVPQP